jgi:glycosyltransferase involved in cell wall biosynthesis
MRIALICPTIGQTRRGYERYFTDLFRFTQNKVDITLFKGAGDAGPRERVVPHLSRTGILGRICGRRFRGRRYQVEFASFAALIAPSILRGGYDLAHVIDPPLCRYLAQLRRFASNWPKLLFSNAGPLSYDASRWVDHVHCLSPLACLEAARLGIRKDHLTLLPIGVDCNALVPSTDRAELRRRAGIAADQFVILAIAALNRHHKRVDFLIEEVARLDSSCILWVDGSMYPDGDASLLDLGRRLLGSRFRHTHVSSESVADLFSLADTFVSTATYESFGMAISEAMAAGMPVVVHDSEHFRWLAGSQGHFVDMSLPGMLSRRLTELMANPGELRRPVDPQAVIRRFGWPDVADQHIAMYRRVIEVT